MHRILYVQVIHKRGWFGIPYAVVKLRTAHVDDRNWQRLKGRPFSLAELMGCPEPTGE